MCKIIHTRNYIAMEKNRLVVDTEKQVQISLSAVCCCKGTGIHDLIGWIRNWISHSDSRNSYFECCISNLESRMNLLSFVVADCRFVQIIAIWKHTGISIKYFQIRKKGSVD